MQVANIDMLITTCGLRVLSPTLSVGVDTLNWNNRFLRPLSLTWRPDIKIMSGNDGEIVSKLAKLLPLFKKRKISERTHRRG